MLNGTSCSVDFDLPKEMADARFSLWPFYKQLRNIDRDAKIQIVYPAKVIQIGEWLRMQCQIGQSM